MPSLKNIIKNGTFVFYLRLKGIKQFEEVNPMKKILSGILTAGIVVSLLASPINAAVLASEELIIEKGGYTYDEPTPEMMEEMIKRVRPLIDVPEEYTEFNWDFCGGYSYSSPAEWRFYWSDGINGEISVSCDLQGRITSYNDYKYNSERKAVLPSVNPEELQPVANAFIKKTAPYLADMDLRLEAVNLASVFYNHSYTYIFTRYENDIPVPENTVRVEVNHISKKAQAFYSSVNADVKFEKPENIISEDEAKKILSENQSMTLSYRLKTEYDDEGILKSRSAYLVYTPEKNYISVDAQSKDVYFERNTWTADENGKLTAGGAFGSIMNDSASKEEASDSEAEKRYQLTEQELEQLGVLESLITKDEASGKIFENEDLYICENAYLSDARLTKRYDYARPLSQDGEKEEKYVWNLSFMSPGEAYLGMNAVVDASTGEIISFYADLPYVYHYEEYGIEAPQLKYTKDEAIEIASAFIKKQQPEKFENVVYSDCYDYAPLKYIENEKGETETIYRAGRINFVRQNEGVNFTYNSFNMGVDLATGKVTRYSYTWYDDVSFESPKDAVDAKDALMSLYGYDGFGINYEINKNYTYVDGKYDSVNAEVYSRPVYSAYDLGTTIIRAIDGKMINYNNDEIIHSENIYKKEYSDMQNHWARETVRRFMWIGYGPEEDMFRPNESITGEDFIILCENVRIYSDNTQAMKLETISRMDAVKLIIDCLGYKKIAALENVFITDFADNADFKDGDVGYAAIARGFGIIEGDGESFRPYDTLTRAEALTLIENVTELGMLND